MVDKKPIISIIIPMYNVENYIAICLNSIIQNDLKNVEVIIVNDGSTDNSRTIAKRYQAKYSQIRVYDKENAGVSRARNYGLSKSTGDWIWFVDSDDAIRKGSLEYIKKMILTCYSNLDVLIFGYLRFEEKKDIDKSCSLNRIDDSKRISKFQAMGTLLDERFATFPWNKIFRRELFKKIAFPEDRIYTEDLAIIYKLYDKATHFRLENTALYLYRIRENGLTHNLSTKKLKDSALSHYEMYTFFKANYSSLSTKLRRETLISAISFFHRLNKSQIQLYPDLIKFLNQDIYMKDCNARYKIEIWAFKKCYPLFVTIGMIGKILRRLKNLKKGKS